MSLKKINNNFLSHLIYTYNTYIMLFCLACKKKTANENEKYETTKNNRKMLKATCKECGKKKNQFVKKAEKIKTHD